MMLREKLKEIIPDLKNFELFFNLLEKYIEEKGINVLFKNEYALFFEENKHPVSKNIDIVIYTNKNKFINLIEDLIDNNYEIHKKPNSEAHIIIDGYTINLKHSNNKFDYEKYNEIKYHTYLFYFSLRLFDLMDDLKEIKEDIEKLKLIYGEEDRILEEDYEQDCIEKVKNQYVLLEKYNKIKKDILNDFINLEYDIKLI